MFDNFEYFGNFDGDCNDDDCNDGDVNNMCRSVTSVAPLADASGITQTPTYRTEYNLDSS